MRVKLMKIADVFLRFGSCCAASENASVVWADGDGRPVGQLHDVRQVWLTENVDGGDPRGRERLLDGPDQLGFGKNLWANIDIEKAGIQPVIDIVLERDSAAGQAKDDQEYRGGGAHDQMDFQKNRSHAHGREPAAERIAPA